MQRKLIRIVLTVAALALLLPSSIQAKKFPNVGVKCPKDFPELRVDAVGTRDVCVALADARCEAGLSLKVDAEENRDACVAEGGDEEASAEPASPKCPKKQQLEVREGRDRCAREAPPKCRGGYTMKTSVGPDMCIR
jgi:hypothetical protein